MNVVALFRDWNSIQKLRNSKVAQNWLTAYGGTPMTPLLRFYYYFRLLQCNNSYSGVPFLICEKHCMTVVYRVILDYMVLDF